MTKLKLTLLMLFSITQLSAQITEVVYLEENNVTRDFYTLLHPPEHPKGYVVILPGFGQSAEMALEQSDLPTGHRSKWLIDHHSHFAGWGAILWRGQPVPAISASGDRRCEEPA